jgi:hypothetical protein
VSPEQHELDLVAGGKRVAVAVQLEGDCPDWLSVSR